MFSVSSAFLEALRTSHRIAVRGRAFAGTTPVLVAGSRELLITGGEITADGGSFVRRTVRGLEVTSPDGRSSTLRNALTTTGTEILLERGVVFPNGRIEYVPVGRFRVNTVEDDVAKPGVVTISGSDRFVRVVDDRFLAPRSAVPGLTVGMMIERLIRESVPNAAVFGTTGIGARGWTRAGVVWEEDRAQAVADLARSVGAGVYADPTGSFVIAAEKTLADPADWLIDSGRTGVLLGGRRTITRDGVYSVVVASSSPTDGGPPVTATAEDTSPTSPTYVRGPFGRVPRFYSSPLLATVDQAAAAARSILGRSIGARSSLSLESAVNPAIEVGDRIDVFLPDGGFQRHIVDGFSFPLGPGPMTVETRSASEVTSE